MAKKSFFQLQKDKYDSSGLRKKFSKKAIKWFEDNISNLKVDSRSRIINDKALIKRNEPLVGKMFHFSYDPKTKENLPYWDRFPLILMVEDAPGGFYGLNLHYLPPLYRAKFFSELLDYKSNKAYDQYTKIKLSYDLLKGTSKLKAFAPTFKRYLFSHIKSNVMQVPAEYWEIATFLPTENFKGANKQRIWSESKRMII